jgi:hypothetical protein
VIHKNKIRKPAKKIRESSSNIQIINSNLLDSNIKFDINYSYITNASNLDEGKNNPLNLVYKSDDSNSNKNEIEKLRIEINKRKEYELKISEEYQKLLRNFQVVEQENKALKGENESSISKKKSIKESEV